MANKLPKGFEALEPYVDDWSLGTTNGRYDKRRTSTAAEIKDFYDAVLPQLEAILDKADEYPLGEMPEDVTRLYDLAMMMAEVSPHIELYGGQPGVPHAFEESRFVAVGGDMRS